MKNFLLFTVFFLFVGLIIGASAVSYSGSTGLWNRVNYDLYTANTNDTVNINHSLIVQNITVSNITSLDNIKTDATIVSSSGSVLGVSVGSKIFYVTEYPTYWIDFNVGGGLFTAGMGFYGNTVHKSQISFATGRFEGEGVKVNTSNTNVVIELPTTVTVPYKKPIFTSSLAPLGLFFFYDGGNNYHSIWQCYNATLGGYADTVNITLAGTGAGNVKFLNKVDAEKGFKTNGSHYGKSGIVSFPDRNSVVQQVKIENGIITSWKQGGVEKLS